MILWQSLSFMNQYQFQLLSSSTEDSNVIIQFNITKRGTSNFLYSIRSVFLFFFSDGPVYQLNTYCVAHLRLLRDGMDTPWWRLTVTCMCLEGRQTTLYPMNCTAMMWTHRHGRSFSPAQTVRYENAFTFSIHSISTLMLKCEQQIITLE